MQLNAVKMLGPDYKQLILGMIYIFTKTGYFMELWKKKNTLDYVKF